MLDMPGTGIFSAADFARRENITLEGSARRYHSSPRVAGAYVFVALAHLQNAAVRYEIDIIAYACAYAPFSAQLCSLRAFPRENGAYR